MRDIRPAGRSARLGVLGRLVLVAYAAATLLTPLSHHDLVCHLKSRTHCTTCVLGSSAEPDSSGVPATHVPLTDAGSAQALPLASCESRPHGSIPSRAPPAVFVAFV
jgi:hypothetical protein